MAPDDFSALYEVLADSDIMQHYPYTFDESRVRRWIDRNIERYETDGFGLWAVCTSQEKVDTSGTPFSHIPYLFCTMAGSFGFQYRSLYWAGVK